MKKVFIIGMLFCTLLMTGCGCEKKKEKTKTLKCSYKDETMEDSFTIYFDDEIAKSFDSEQIYYFSSNEEAIEAVSGLNKENVTIDDKIVIMTNHYDYSENEILTYDEFMKMYSNYDCK